MKKDLGSPGGPSECTASTHRGLCKVCTEFPLLQYLEAVVGSDPAKEPWRPYHQTQESFEESRKLCSLCSLLGDMFTADVEKKERGDARVKLYREKRIARRANIRPFPAYIQIRVFAFHLRNLPQSQLCFKTEAAFAQLELCSQSFDQKDPLKRFEGRCQIDPDPKSELSVRLLTKWIDECDTSHPECNWAKEVPLPTRVLDLGDDTSDTVRLVESNTKCARYVALSHCWGNVKQQFNSTSVNLALRKQSIAIPRMPQTFQDAIWVTRKMSFRYLWIDSLCIIQDDPDDWKRESGRMGLVYSGAAVTIAASRAKSHAHGFLQPRSTPERILIEKADFQGNQVSLLLNPFVPERVWNPGGGTGFPFDPVQKEPLTGRAWALQERYLSHRMVFFAETEMFWECSSMTASEDGQRTLRSRHQISSLTWPLPIPVANATKRKYRAWYSMVSQYTECGLTYEKDIFPAFSGIAKAVGDVTGASFCAGIWSDDLARGLSWKRQPQSDWNGGISRTKSYQAPSFSWASCKGAVSYSNLGWDKDQDPGFILLCNYLTHQLYHSGDEYGPLSGGWLKVEAPIIPVKNIKHWIFDEPDCRSMHLIIVLKREPCQLCGSFDRNDGTSGKLFLLLLAKLDVDPPRPYEAIQSEFIFLIIRQLEVEAQPTFERVGSGRSCISLCDDHSAVVTGDREWNLAMERVEHQRNMKLQLLNMPKEIVTLV